MEELVCASSTGAPDLAQPVAPGPTRKRRAERAEEEEEEEKPRLKRGGPRGQPQYSGARAQAPNAPPLAETKPATVKLESVADPALVAAPVDEKVPAVEEVVVFASLVAAAPTVSAQAGQPLAPNNFKAFRKVLRGGWELDARKERVGFVFE